MTPPDGLSVGWQPRDVPLLPRGVVARGPAAVSLARRVLHAACPWRGLVGDRLVLVCADGSDPAPDSGELPWVDGAVYVAPIPEAPSLWGDTRLAPDLPGPLVARAVGRVRPGAVLWLLDPPALVPLGALDRMDPGRLSAWVAERA